MLKSKREAKQGKYRYRVSRIAEIYADSAIEVIERTKKKGLTFKIIAEKIEGG